MPTWAEEELCYANLGDTRRNRRLIRIVEDLAAQPSTSVPQASRDAAALQGIYDFWSSPYVQPASILASHYSKTIERIEQQENSIVLAIQDTTEFNFSHHPATAGMGYLDSAQCRGLKCHSVLCVDEQGIPLGLLEQDVWARDLENLGKKHQRHQKPTQDKESQKWLDSLEATQQRMPETAKWVMVGDREADIYDLFALAETEQADFLIRAAQDRLVSSPINEETQRLSLALEQVSPAGEEEVELQRHPARAARIANLTIRFATLAVHPPQSRPKAAGLKPISVQVILAEEEHPPQGQEPICWLLLTTLKVETLEDALKCMRWYSYRWLIERYHFVLKSGCRIEQLQLATAERIHRALATYAIVAWRLLWLTYEARYNPEQPCNTVFETYEWQALYVTIHKTNRVPEAPPTLKQAVRWVAQLGGFIGRKRDGEPGVKTIWRGLRRLHDIAQTWRLANPELYPSVKGVVNLIS